MKVREMEDDNYGFRVAPSAKLMINQIGAGSGDKHPDNNKQKGTNI